MGDFHQSHVIDRILQHGTDLYNLHFRGQSRFVLASELPSVVQVAGVAYKCVQSDVFSGLIDVEHSVEETQTLSLYDALTRTFLQSSYCLLTLGNFRGTVGYTTAVVKQNEKVVSFDSHSRCPKGLQAASGKAVVMEATTVKDFVLYVRELTKSLHNNTADHVPFEVVSMNCKELTSEINEASRQKEALVKSAMRQNGQNGNKANVHEVATNKLPKQRTELTRASDTSVFQTVNTSGRKMVRCSVCFKHPHIARMFSNKKNQLPAVCSEFGTAPRKELLESHLASEMHKECMKADLDETLHSGHGKKTVKAMFTAQQKHIAVKMFSCLYTVFNDAKRGTLSAWSWPSREVANLFGAEFKNEDIADNPVISNESLQYLVPQMHAELLECIVAADKQSVKDKVLKSLAVSIRADGSVDRTQIDNVHVMARIVTADGDTENVFLGFAEPETRGATGYTDAIKKATSFIVNWDEIFPKVTSIVTDGASINVGEKNGMWAQLQKSRDESLFKTVPLIKIWCTVHRSSLAWKSVCCNVKELNTLVIDLTGIASFFRQSGIRTRELHALAKAMNFKVFQMPKYFEVRWAEFTYSLCRAVIGSWRAIVSYLKSQPEGDATQFLSKWTEYGRVQLLCFVSDVTYVFSKFQKSLQYDSILLSQIPGEVTDIISKLRRMQTSPLLGGWEELFTSETTVKTVVQKVNGQDEITNVTYLYDIELTAKTRRGKSHNKYVSDRRKFAAIRHEILESLINFLEQRLDMPQVSALRVLEILDVNVSDAELRSCHRILCPDKNLIDFADEYRSAASLLQRSLDKQASDNLLESPKVTLNLTSAFRLIQQFPSSKFPVLKTSMARVIAAKPHSADVERLISYYNLVKTSDRYTLLLSVSNGFVSIYLILFENGL